MSGQRVGIVGSRTWPRPQDVAARVALLPPGTVVVSGGAEGVDTFAVEAAKLCGLPDPAIHLPNLARYGSPSAAYHQAKAIADDCDRLIAFAVIDPTTKSITAGTQLRIDLATKRGIDVEIVRSPLPGRICVMLHRFRSQLAKVQGEGNPGRRRAMTKRLLALATELTNEREVYESRMNDGWAEVEAETDNGEKERKEQTWIKWLRSYEAICDALNEAVAVL